MHLRRVLLASAVASFLSFQASAQSVANSGARVEGQPASELEAVPQPTAQYTVNSAASPSAPSALNLFRGNTAYLLEPALTYEAVTDSDGNEEISSIGFRQKVEFQIGTIDNSPVLAFVDAPANKDLAAIQPDLDKVFQSLRQAIGKNNSPVEQCVNGEECVETCNFGGIERCCKWRCK